MIPRPLCLALALAVGLAALPATAQEGASPERANCAKGVVAGHWKSPSPAEPGQVGGALIVPEEGPLLKLEGKLFPVVSLPPFALGQGLLRGSLRLPAEEEGGEAEVVARVRGQWMRTGPKGGLFQAKVVRPSEVEGEAPTVVGRIEGKFFDPVGDGEPGKLKGQWRLCE